ncbi:MAG: MgtC/SapB family protein [Anaerolineales bacterium]|nr:MgtC/SapB family protein [Anaerolineales bacterium]
MGDAHSLLAPELVGPVVSLVAILCGGLTGFERQRAAKPAGFRTMILICLGSAIFTQASILLGGGPGHADRARVAAQVVTGIGFLGAGAIIGSGTVSNYDRSRGSACLAERRTLETIEHGAPRTSFLKFGDRVRIEMFDAAGASIFGAIDQRVTHAMMR